MLQVNAVTRMFGQKAAVDNASFTVDRPAFVGIIGRSGAGKSTLLRMMNRLLDASSGEIPVDGSNVLALKGARARDWQSQCALTSSSSIWCHGWTLPRTSCTAS